MAQTQSVTLEKHGRFTFDVDVYAQTWDSHRQYSELHLRGIVASMAYDSVRDVDQGLSRFELIAMLAEFETNRLNLFEGKSIY
ncbi:hypothetical protein REDROCK_93 [Mycobacterium phage RedRock]|uniref:Uncharacterized protein n=1 Tax=Mycobacterium phage RedRock TaxID=711470 RepID=D3JZF5_9CAUD|nr:hypothetical protein O153_gp13 [Mycobacterium phage AnnaL29]YP_009101346.1 hypothetical protein REDROCK_93 [Mycobacterium phage RedRock]ADB93786.1 hypothetical protein REDROCK_93 [Mycobacterium phage RedRock]AGS82775.1 hypothetical protein ANNAL29_94 [Mycobacterium phage AnnaL29]